MRCLKYNLPHAKNDTPDLVNGKYGGLRVYEASHFMRNIISYKNIILCAQYHIVTHVNKTNK